MSIKSLKIFNMSTRSKLLILGMLLSSVLIVVTAYFAINNTQKKIFDSYYNFGQMMTKTMAKQTVDELQLAETNTDQTEKYKKIKNNAETLVQNNDDIAFVSFTDATGIPVYSIEKEKFKPLDDFSFSAPVFIETVLVVRSASPVSVTVNELKSKSSVAAMDSLLNHKKLDIITEKIVTNFCMLYP